jgi:hypothetical protein
MSRWQVDQARSRRLVLLQEQQLLQLLLVAGARLPRLQLHRLQLHRLQPPLAAPQFLLPPRAQRLQPDSPASAVRR